MSERHAGFVFVDVLVVVVIVVLALGLVMVVRFGRGTAPAHCMPATVYRAGNPPAVTYAGCP